MTKIKTAKQIEALQKGYRVTDIQNTINTGICWMMEGFQGRFAMQMLKAGVCMLPTNPTRDYYGNTVPARTMLKEGTKGTLQNACEFWQKVQDGDFEAIEGLEEIFGRDEEDEVK